MNKIIFITFAMIITGTTMVTGANGSKKSAAAKADTARMSFEHIIINGDIDVVLTPSSIPGIRVIEGERNVSTVHYFIKKGTLYVDRNSSEGLNQPTVYIAVADLKTIEVNGKSMVSSQGALNSNKLKVFINNDVTFNVRNRGEVKLEASNEIDLKYSISTVKPGTLASF